MVSSSGSRRRAVKHAVEEGGSGTVSQACRALRIESSSSCSRSARKRARKVWALEGAIVELKAKRILATAIAA